MKTWSPQPSDRNLTARPGLVLGISMTLCWLLAAGALAAERFVDGIDDLPLMPALEMVPEANVAFDTGTGRIVVAFADEVRPGDMAFDAVVSYYAATLPQLGWTEESRSERLARWTREGEELVLEAVAAGPELVVRFSLSPR